MQNNSPKATKNSLKGHYFAYFGGPGRGWYEVAVRLLSPVLAHWNGKPGLVKLRAASYQLSQIPENLHGMIENPKCIL